MTQHHRRNQYDSDEFPRHRGGDDDFGTVGVPGMEVHVTPPPVPDGEPPAPKASAPAAPAASENPAPAAPDDEYPEGHVLLVDDNVRYREAFSRHLRLEGFGVTEASDSHEAMQALSTGTFDLVITDLAMRTETEGLELIRSARQRDPLLPIIMISAVGTFEEGAEASRLGAVHVVSKMKIDAEFDLLLRRARNARDEHRRQRELARQLEDLRVQAQILVDDEAPASPTPAPDAAAISRALRTLLADATLAPSLKSEAYDLSMALGTAQSRADAARVLAGAMSVPSSATTLTPDQIDEILRGVIPDFDTLDPDTLQAIRTAEFLYNMGGATPESIDFSRSIGFSYCFAVENQAKARLRRRLQRFFAARETAMLLPRFLERDQRHMNLFFHQYLLAIMRSRNMDVTTDNVRQVLMRLAEHGGRYKPDGLKALGIVVVCFGRSYSFSVGQQVVRVDNPLGLRGLEGDREVLDFAELLIALQHYRNPYIHPEISEMEKISKIRATSFNCLRFIQRLQA